MYDNIISAGLKNYFSTLFFVFFRCNKPPITPSELNKIASDAAPRIIQSIKFSQSPVAGTSDSGSGNTSFCSEGILFAMNKPFVPVRKKGKLPRATIEESYDLEYGKATVEIHKDDIRPGMKAVIVDDLIATGGTCEASIRLLERLGAKVVKAVFVMELAGLEGRKNLEGYDVESLICYEGK